MSKLYKVILSTPDQIQFIHRHKHFQKSKTLIVTFSSKLANSLCDESKIGNADNKHKHPQLNKYKQNAVSMREIEDCFPLAFGKKNEIEKVYTFVSDYLNTNIRNKVNVDFNVALYKNFSQTMRTLLWYLYANPGSYLRYSRNNRQEQANTIIEEFLQHAFIKKLHDFINQVEKQPDSLAKSMEPLFKKVMGPIFERFGIDITREKPHLVFYEPIFITNFQNTIIQFLSVFCDISVAYHFKEQYSDVFKSVEYFANYIVGENTTLLKLSEETSSKPSAIVQYILGDQFEKIPASVKADVEKNINVLKLENREALVRYLNTQKAEDPIVAIRYKEIMNLMEKVREKQSIFDTSLGNLIINILLMRSNQVINDEISKVERFHYNTLMEIFKNQDFMINGKSASRFVPVLTHCENVLINCTTIDELMERIEQVMKANDLWRTKINCNGYTKQQLKQLEVHKELEWMKLSVVDLRMVKVGLLYIKELSDEFHQNLSPGNLATLLNQFIENNHYKLSNEDEFVSQIIDSVKKLEEAYTGSVDSGHLMSKLKMYFTASKDYQVSSLLNEEEELEEVNTVIPLTSIQNGIVNSLDNTKNHVTIVTADHEIFPLSQLKKLNFLDEYSIFHAGSRSGSNSIEKFFELDKARMDLAESISLYYLYHLLYFAEKLDVSYEEQIDKKTMFLSYLLQRIEDLEQSYESTAITPVQYTNLTMNVYFNSEEGDDFEYGRAGNLCVHRARFLKNGAMRVTRTWPELSKLHGKYIQFFKDYYECIKNPTAPKIEQPYLFRSAEEAYAAVDLLFPMLSDSQKHSNRKEVLVKQNRNTQQSYITYVGDKSFLQKRRLFDFGVWTKKGLEQEGLSKVGLCRKCQFRGICTDVELMNK